MQVDELDSIVLVLRRQSMDAVSVNMRKLWEQKARFVDDVGAGS